VNLVGGSKSRLVTSRLLVTSIDVLPAVETGDLVLVSTAVLLTPFHPLMPEQGFKYLLLKLLVGMEIN